MNRSAETPYLYNYSIDLIGYSLSDVNSLGSVDAQEEYKNRLTELGLDGVKSATLKATAANAAKSVNNLSGSIKRAGIKI